jgi:predicted O-methyltransferase YrrM
MVMVGSLSSASDDEFVAWCFRTVLRREGDTDGIRHFVSSLQSGVSRLSVLQEFLECVEYRNRAGSMWRFVPPGHYYSPIPSDQEVDEFARQHVLPDSIHGVDLNDKEQLELLEHLALLYPSVPFTDEPQPGFRYRYVNPSYSYADAIFLHTMLRHIRPKRLIEIGSGYSSAVTLDTNERFLDNNLDCCFIEPFPELLQTLLHAADHENVRIIPNRLQDVDLPLFQQLEAGDILFVDSTHVSKVHSDVNRLVFEILPSLKPGVLIHFHDVFYPFEYPLDWLREGRAWNEQYVLRAFLQFNPAFKIKLFGDYMTHRYAAWFRERMPLCLENTGGALWLERIA